MIKIIYKLLSLLFLSIVFLSVDVYAIPDGAGNEVFPSVNVGIGTTSPQAAFVVTNGNVGIGTWTASQILDVKGNITASGTITGSSIVGTLAPSSLEVTGTATVGTSSGNLGVGTTLTGANAKLAVIGGNVGLGSITPGQILDVQGTARMTGFTLSLSPSTGYVLQTNSVGVGTWVSPSTIVSAGGSPSGGQNAVQYNNASAFAGSESVFSFNGTNVGIGTTNGVQVLDVRTTASMAMNVGIGTSATGIAARLAVIGGNVGIGTITPQGGFVVTNGNVGIGTWVAPSLLAIGPSASSSKFYGAIKSDGTQSLLNMDATMPTTPSAAVQGVKMNFTTAGSASQYQDGLEVNLLAGYTGDQRNSAIHVSSAVAGSSLHYAASNAGIRSEIDSTASGHNIAFQTYAVNRGSGNAVGTSGAAWGALGSGMRIGLVGSVVANPSSSAAGVYAYLWSASDTALTLPSDYAVIIADNSSIAAPLFKANVSGANKVIISSVGNVGIATTTPQAGLVAMSNVGIGTWTADGGNLIVRGNGNVGIGSAWPGQKLDVQGTIRTTGFTLNLSPSTGYVLQTNSVGVGTWVAPSTILTASGSPSGGQNAVQYNSSSAFAGSEAVFSFNGTNVGIGTTNGTQLLDVRGTVGIRGGNVGIGTSTPQGALTIINGNVGIATWAPTGYFQINKPSASPFIVTSGGNVGIGTITPQGALTVTNGNVGIATLAPTGYLQINRPASSPFIVTSTGNVGIGTITPQTALAITNGNVGIGTLNAFGGVLIIPSGNVGIGSLTPNGVLDVTSTATATAGMYNNQYNFMFANPGSASSAIYNGLNSTNYFLGDGATASLRGIAGVTASISGNLSTNYGLLFYAQNSSSDTITSNYGAFAGSVNASSGTITSAIGLHAAASNESNGAVTNAYGLVAGYSNSGSGTTTQAFGGSFSVTRPAGTITTGYGIHVGNVEATTKWSVYASDSTAPNYFAGNVGINSLSPGTKLDVMSVDNGTGARVLIPATSGNVTAADVFVSFNSSSGQIGTIAGTGSSGVIAYNTFTGSHWTQVEDVKEIFELALLCSTGEVVSWSQEQLTKTRLCSKDQDPSVLGAYGGRDNQGHDLALSIGTGYLWVVNKGQDLAIGDYLTSSDVKGYAQKQTDNIYRNYTAAKVMQPIKWQKNERSRKVAVIYEGG